MKFKLVALIIMFAFAWQTLLAQDTREPLSTAQVRAIAHEQIRLTENIFHWKDVDDYTVWSALVTSDSLVSIGYKPTHITNFKKALPTANLQDADWVAARKKIVDHIVRRTEEIYGPRYDRRYLMPFGEVKPLPFVHIRVFNQSIVEEIRQMPEVRYFDLMTFSFEEEDIFREGEGCGTYSDNIASQDTVPTSPKAVQSWHHAEHNINAAWANSNKGAGTWVAVFDTGISANQDKLNADFAEGESAGRVVEKEAFFNNDGWQDDCGHGTAMASLATAPKGFDDMATGVAYQANLVSYRVTNDVLINEAEEIDGTSMAFFDAANDPRIQIISMSLGNISSNGAVSDGVIYAHGKGKLIFAAAGTSTGATSWYPVIFPAWMPETVAVTGVTTASQRERCNNCHDGPEVDFVICMERANNGNLSVTNSMNSGELGYVGGSSCATATTAGIAALVWGNNPSWSKDQVLTALIQSADYYPQRNSNFGWGKIDANIAVQAEESGPCATNVSNEVMIEITNISFPATSDGGNEAEWVILFNGARNYFDVNENGDSGPPSNFINISVCGALPLFVNLGNTACGQSTIDLLVESHEDDSFQGNCNFNSGDDSNASQIVSVDFLNNTFTHTSPAGNFVFTYTSSCVQQSLPPVATVNGSSDLCQNASPEDVTIQGSGGTAPYTVSYTINGGTPQTITTTGNTALLPQSTATQGTFTYQLLDVTDANGCMDVLNSSFTVTVHPAFTPSIVDDSPVCSGTMATVTVSPAGETDYIFYIDANTNGAYDIGEEVQNGAYNTYTSTSFNDGDVVGVVVTNSNNCLEDIQTTITILPNTDPACTNPCPSNYALSGNEMATADYETDGTITSTQIIQSGAIVDYDSATSIELNGGFEVVVGAVFCAFIDGCGGANVEEEDVEEK